MAVLPNKGFDQWLGCAAFAQPADGQCGNMGVNNILGILGPAIDSTETCLLFWRHLFPENESAKNKETA